MLFEDEKKANLFLQFNTEDILAECGYSPIRSYFCIACNGWHVTSQNEAPNYKSVTENVLEKYTEAKIKKKKEVSAQKESENKFIECIETINNQINDFEIAVKKGDSKKRSELFNLVCYHLKTAKELANTKKKKVQIDVVIQRLSEKSETEERRVLFDI